MSKLLLRRLDRDLGFGVILYTGVVCPSCRLSACEIHFSSVNGRRFDALSFEAASLYSLLFCLRSVWLLEQHLSVLGYPY